MSATDAPKVPSSARVWGPYRRRGDMLGDDEKGPSAGEPLSVDDKGLSAGGARSDDDKGLSAGEPPSRETQPPEFGKAIPRSLYALYFFSGWADRMFEFLLFTSIQDAYIDTLAPVSAYGITVTAAGILGSAAVGALVDRLPRLKAVGIALGLQKLCIALTAVLLFVLLHAFPDSASRRSDTLAILILGGVVLGGCGLKLASAAWVLCIERDWILVITEGRTAELSQLNAIIRRIDLVAKIGAPFFVSLISSLLEPKWAAAFAGLWSTVSLFIEMFCLQFLYRSIPRLALPKAALRHEYIELSLTNSEVCTTNTVVESQLPLADLSDDTRNEGTAHRKGRLSRQWGSWCRFCRHRTFLPCLAISTLYMTVLSFGGQMIAYLKYRGMSDAVISVVRGLSVLVGLSATFVTPQAVLKFGVDRVGLWSITSQALCLAPVLGSFWLPDIQWGTGVLIAGVAASRFGLWSFDLCQIQIMQERVDNSEAGSIGGWQTALSNLFELIQYGLTLVVSAPDLFVLPAAASCGAVFVALLTYAVYVHRERGHLFHIPALKNHRG